MSFPNNIPSYSQANTHYVMSNSNNSSSYHSYLQPSAPIGKGKYGINNVKSIPTRRGWGWGVVIGTHRNNQNYLHTVFEFARNTADKTMESHVVALLRKNQDRSTNDLLTRVSLIAAAVLAVVGLVAGIHFFLFIAAIIAGASIFGAVIHGIVEEEDSYFFNSEIEQLEKQFKPFH